MRGSVLVASAAVHVALLAAFMHWLDRDEKLALAGTAPAPPPPTPIEILPPSVAPPIDVVVLPPDAPTPPTAPAPPAAPAPAPHHAAAPTSTNAVASASAPAGTAPTETTTTEQAHPTDNPFMRMRGRDRDLPTIGDTLDKIAAEGSAAPPPEVPKTGMLRETGHDTAKIYDTVTTVAVAADGTVKFHDKSAADIHFALPFMHMDLDGIGREIGQGLRDWAEDPYAQTRVGTTQDQPRTNQAVPGQCDEWGSCSPTGGGPGIGHAAESNDNTGGGSVIPILGGHLDVTDWLMRRHKMDPYASRKLKILDATRDERVARGDAHKTEQLAQAGEYMRKNLATLYTANGTPAEKREALFELWDECAEGDGPLGEAGQRARMEVIGWIAVHIPKGKPDAFTDDELAAFNARRSSKQRFAPY